MKPSGKSSDAKVKVPGVYIKHHVKDEERPGGRFRQAKKTDEDLDAMGELSRPADPARRRRSILAD